METSGYNLRQRPFSVSTTADRLATIVTSSVSTVMSYPSTSSSSTGGSRSAPTMANLCQETMGADSARGIGIGLAAEPVDPAASSGGLLVQSNVVNVDDVTVSTVESAQSAAPLPLLTQQQASASVAVSNVSDASVVSVVRADVRADRPGVHADLTDQAYDSEVSAYFRDDSPPPPAPFYYGPSPPGVTLPFASVHSRAESRQSRTSYRSVGRQLRAPSRQSVISLRFHVSGRQSTHSQALDPVIELMNKMFDKVASDAVAQRADVADQRADADRREQQMQVRMDAEFARRDAEMSRREKEAADKARLQLENELLREKIAAVEKRPTDMQSLSPLPATAQLDMHADRMIPAVAGAHQPAPGDIHALMISAGRQHAHSPPPVATAGAFWSAPGDAHTPVTSADSQHFTQMRSAILAPGLMMSADGHTQSPPPPTVDSVNCTIAGANVTAAAPNVHTLALLAPAPADTQHIQHATLPAPDSLISDHTVEMRSGSDDFDLTDVKTPLFFFFCTYY